MKEILVALDFSGQAEPVLEVAAELARGLGAELTIVHVAAPDPTFVSLSAGPQTVRDTRAEELHEEHDQLRAWAEALTERGIPTKSLLIQGSTADAILSEAERLEVDLIVVGSHAKGAISRIVLGSVSESVIRSTRCPVLVVPPPEG